jgi:mycothiol synthase
MSGVRTYREDDFDALLDLINAAHAPARTTTATGLREILDYAWFYPETDLFLVPSGGGPELLGARDIKVWARGDEPVPILESWGVLRPRTELNASDDAARMLFRAVLDRAGEIVADRGAGRGIIQARCDDHDVAAMALFESCGFSQARVLLTIVRPTLDDLRPAQFPGGIDVRPYRRGRDEAQWVEAFNEAFADHWGGFMGMSLAQWTKLVHRPWFKPDLSLVAWDGDEIAGFGHFIIHDEQNALSRKKESVMRYIGVRPRWRGIGLGVALTRAGLIASRDRGMEACVSGVDSENVTGAHRIYEREGFVTTKRQFMYRADVAAAPRPTA